MITKETAIRIYSCFREIEAATGLLAEMEENIKQHKDDINLRDPFGRKRCLELGVPMGNDSHRLFQVQPSLAFSVIRAHIAHKEAELKEANEQARIELETVSQNILDGNQVSA